QAFAGIGFVDYALPTMKTVVFGFIIGVVSSYLGYTATGGSEGIGRASTRSVVFSSMLPIVINVLLVRIIFILFPAGALCRHRSASRREQNPPTAAPSSTRRRPTCRTVRP